MSMYSLTLYGLYKWDTSLFDNMIFPKNADKENFIDSLILSYGMCEPLYPDFDFMKNSAIPAWSKKWQRSIEKVFNLLEQLDYEPIENYDRKEEWSDSPDITRINAASGSDTGTMSAGQTQKTTQSGSDSNEQTTSAFNSDTYDPKDKTTVSYGNSTTVESGGKDVNEMKYGRTDTSTEKGTTIHSGHIHGNIGVTTSQQMAQSELDLRKQSFIDYCTNLFAHELLLLVY